MTNLPTQAGDTVYASKDGVYIYKDANIDSDKFGNFATGGDISYAKGSFLGPYTGLEESGFYQITASRKIRIIPLLPKQTQTFKGWVLGNQVTTLSGTDVAEAKSAKQDAALKDTIDGLTGSKNPITASTNTTTNTPKNNSMWYLLGGLTLLLSAAWLYLSRKKKPIITTIPPIYPAIKK